MPRWAQRQVWPSGSLMVRLILLKKLVSAISKLIAPSCSSVKWALTSSQISSVTPSAPSCSRVAASAGASAARSASV